MCQLQEGTAADAGGLRDTLLYNGALQALLLGRPATALRCFRVRCGCCPAALTTDKRTAQVCGCCCDCNAYLSFRLVQKVAVPMRMLVGNGHADGARIEAASTLLADGKAAHIACWWEAAHLLSRRWRPHVQGTRCSGCAWASAA